MASLIPNFEYDIFISYRHKDNKTGWVTEFVERLKNEIEATFKEDISIYFDSNPHDGLHETHDVDGSLKEKVKCLVFIPIVSQTYCDASSFAWQKEFLAFIDFAKKDNFGLDIKLPGGNVTKRVLPVRIHEIEEVDKNLFESEIMGVMRPVDFIYRETGVNRPLKSTDEKYENLNKTDYSNQINKVANAIKDILGGMSNDTTLHSDSSIDVGSPFENKSIASEDTKRKRIQSRRDSIARSIQLKRMLRIISLIAFVALIGFGGYWFGNSSQNTEAKLQPIQFDFEIKTFIGAVPFGSLLMAISHDSQIICSTSNEGVYLKSLSNRSDVLLIPGTENGGFSIPFFSPDSKWIGLLDRSTASLVKYPIDGGVLMKICDIGNSGLDTELFTGANWYENTIYFGKGKDIFRVDANGGKPELVYSLPDTTGAIVWNPQLLPDENSILFTIYRNLVPEVVIIKLDDLVKPPVRLMQVHDIHYLSSGEVVFRHEERLYRQAFDYHTLQLKGKPRLIDTSPILARGSRPPIGQFDLSNDILIYRSIDSENRGGNRQVVWIDQKGNIQPITREPHQFYYGPRISPDGTRIIVDIAHSVHGIQVAEIAAATGIFTLFTRGINPIWHPDGQSIIYRDSGKIFQKPLNHSYSPKLLFDPQLTTTSVLRGISPESLSKDARFLVFERTINYQADIGFFDSKDKSIHMLDFINSGKRVITPRLSPDDKWLAFSSDKDGTNQIYVTSFPGPGTVYRVSAEKGYSPVWAPDMKYIYFVDGGHEDSKLYRSRLHIGEEFSSEEPEVLFKGAHVRRPNSQSTNDGIEFGKFDIHPNGQKFLMLNYASEIAPITKVNVVVNWRQLK